MQTIVRDEKGGEERKKTNKQYTLGHNASEMFLIAMKGLKNVGDSLLKDVHHKDA